MAHEAHPQGITDLDISPSIKKNFAYKSALTLSSYLIAFITFPYVSRVLGVERIGLVNFVDNTVGYFLLFATMGVNVLGVREIAASKGRPGERSRVFANVLGLNLRFTAIALAAYLCFVTATPKLSRQAGLFYIGTAKILCTPFVIEWFFTGTEDFRYITLRSLAVKSLYTVAVFAFVRARDDYKLYFIMTVGTVALNALVNSVHVRKLVRPKAAEYFSLRYLKQNCVLGTYSVMGSMYLTFNVMFLGLTSGNAQVGYYTTAFKVYMVVLGFFSAFTNVMIPRMSALLAGGRKGPVPGTGGQVVPGDVHFLPAADRLLDDPGAPDHICIGGRGIRRSRNAHAHHHAGRAVRGHRAGAGHAGAGADEERPDALCGLGRGRRRQHRDQHDPCAGVAKHRLGGRAAVFGNRRHDGLRRLYNTERHCGNPVRKHRTKSPDDCAGCCRLPNLREVCGESFCACRSCRDRPILGLFH